MDLATAHRVVANWDTPLSRYFFWYLVIPAKLVVQRADPADFSYTNRRNWPYRWLYLLRFFLGVFLFAAIGPLAATVGGLPAGLVLPVSLLVFYDLMVSGVWALAYWAMRAPRS